MHRYTEGRDEEAQAPAAGGNNAALARTGVLQPAAEYGGRKPQEHNRNGEDPGQLSLLPVARGGLADANDLGQRELEDTEGVSLADAEVNSQRCGRNQPPIETRPGNDALLGQQARHERVSRD